MVDTFDRRVLRIDVTLNFEFLRSGVSSRLGANPLERDVVEPRPFSLSTKVSAEAVASKYSALEPLITCSGSSSSGWSTLM
jgi:hypothetical protein